MVNIDSLLNHIYEDLRSALRDAVGLKILFDYLKDQPHKFLRQKRKRKNAIPPPINMAA
jgi:hypothetical protein